MTTGERRQTHAPRQRRGIEHSPSVEQFADGLEALADLFGKDELRAAAEARKQAGSEFVLPVAARLIL